MVRYKEIGLADEVTSTTVLAFVERLYMFCLGNILHAYTSQKSNNVRSFNL